MAGEFLRSHGVDIDAEMARIQDGGSATTSDRSVRCIHNVSLPDTEHGKTFDVYIEDGKIDKITEAQSERPQLPGSVNGHGALLASSLCHPHIHIDKAYLLAHPKYSHLQVEYGDFKEAMSLTGDAKSQFEQDDLLERGQRVVDESVAAGVTHMRAFVEVDAGVGVKCLEAGLILKRKAALEKKCHIQICAFAQLPLFSSSQGDENGTIIRSLMREAAARHEVDVLGSTPYVENDTEKQVDNIDWMISLCEEFDKHLDFHLDYSLGEKSNSMVWHVLRMMNELEWIEKVPQKTVALGHCTLLTSFDDEDWQHLAMRIEGEGLPVSFVGLPTSDLFMMRTGQRPEVRGTFDVPKYIRDWSLNACIGINNIGNAFTPYGTCDPVSVASQGIGVYQAGTKQDADLLFECVSVRAKAAIGLGSADDRDIRLSLRPGDDADLVLFGHDAKHDWRTRRSVSEAIYLYDGGQGRKALWRGNSTT